MNELRKGYKIVVIVGMTMIASVFVYAGLVESINRGYISIKFAPFPEVEILKYILLGIALIEFFIIKVVRNLVLSGKSVTTQSYQGRFSLPVQRLLTTSIITYAFCESVAIYGLVVFSCQVILWTFIFSCLYPSSFSAYIFRNTTSGRSG